jgi:glycolate oxidase
MILLSDIEITTEPEDLACYGFDASGMKGNPGMVAWPRSTKEVSSLLKYAQEKGLKVVPRGAGSGMTAGSVPSEGAMVMSLEKMNRILEIDSKNLNVTVEPGVINGTLQQALEKEGFFYPPDPASMGFCTLGGNVAENAGGPRALKYGVTRDYVMQLESILPDRFLPLPEAVTTLLAFFGDVEEAGRAVSEITSARIIPRTLEFMDREAIAAVENFKPTGLPTDIEALLLIELDGHPQAIKQEAEKVVELCRNQGAEVEMAADENARERLWRSRRAVSPALHHLGLKKINEDIVVPRSRLPEMLGSLKRLSSESGIKIINFGHAGDGNIHVNIMVEKEDEERQKKAYALLKEMFSEVIALGGTISGEHGVGLTKAEFIDMEIKKRELELMRGIKGLFDPDNVLNPGKIFKISE